MNEQLDISKSSSKPIPSLIDAIKEKQSDAKNTVMKLIDVVNRVTPVRAEDKLAKAPADGDIDRQNCVYNHLDDINDAMAVINEDLDNIFTTLNEAL